MRRRLPLTKGGGDAKTCSAGVYGLGRAARLRGARGLRADGGLGNDKPRAAGDGHSDNVYCDAGTITAIVEMGDFVDDQRIFSETLLPTGTRRENIQVVLFFR